MTRGIWKGTAFGVARSNTHVSKIVEWYTDGEIYTDDVITLKLLLDPIKGGFDLMHAERAIRNVVVFQVSPASRFVQRIPSPLQKDVKIS